MAVPRDRSRSPTNNGWQGNTSGGGGSWQDNSGGAAQDAPAANGSWNSPTNNGWQDNTTGGGGGWQDNSGGAAPDTAAATGNTGNSGSWNNNDGGGWKEGGGSGGGKAAGKEGGGGSGGWKEGGGSGDGGSLDAATEEKLDAWVKAKRQKDFKTADAIRDELRKLGVEPGDARPASGGKGKNGKDGGKGKDGKGEQDPATEKYINATKLFHRQGEDAQETWRWWCDCNGYKSKYDPRRKELEFLKDFVESQKIPMEEDAPVVQMTPSMPGLQGGGMPMMPSMLGLQGAPLTMPQMPSLDAAGARALAFQMLAAMPGLQGAPPMMPQMPMPGLQGAPPMMMPQMPSWANAGQAA